MQAKLLFPNREITEQYYVPLIYTACRTCYSELEPQDIFERATSGRVASEKQQDLVRRVIDSGHGSTIEHIVFTFAISGVTRTLSHQLVRHRADHPVLEDLVTNELPGVRPRIAFSRDLLLTMAGFGALLYGASFTVDGATLLARRFDVPEEIIGMGIVAIGTSLPELAAGLMATLRGHMELAIGTVIGSNVFNLLLVLAVTICIRPIEVPAGGMTDLAFVAFLSLALMVVSITNRQQILRAEAGLLLLSYLGYLSWRSELL